MESDIPAVVEAANDALILRAVPDLVSQRDPLRAGEWIARHRHSDLASQGMCAWAIANPVTDEMLGEVTVISRKGIPGAEVGYWLRRPARGRGMAAEALRNVRRWAVEAASLPELLAYCGLWNGPSRRTAERAGFHLDSCCAGVAKYRCLLRRERLSP